MVTPRPTAWSSSNGTPQGRVVALLHLTGQAVPLPGVALLQVADRAHVGAVGLTEVGTVVGHMVSGVVLRSLLQGRCISS